VLKRIKFFQELDPGVQAKLPNIVTMTHLLIDTVIFRQDDPPGNCYVLLNGEVGVYMKSGTEPEEERTESKGGSRRPSMTMVEHIQWHQALRAQRAEAEAEGQPPRSGGSDRRRSGSLGLSEAEAAKMKKLQAIQMYPTTEGFSVFTGAVEDLGKQVAVLRGGTIFGELALINDQPRGASIRCHTDCDLLVIRRDDFNRVLKEEMMRAGDEKLNFLAQHVPGMRDIEIPRFIQGKTGPHPAYFLRRATYRRGHFFFTQGTVAQDAIYVVFKGILDIRHREPGTSTGTTAMARRLRPVNRGRIGYARQDKAGEPEATAGTTRTLGTLMAGSAFGSLPVQAAEPYSIVVSSASCEVFQAIGPDMPKLPRRLLEAVREYIANSTAWRLKTYVNHKSIRELPKAPTRSESPPVSEGPRTLQELHWSRLIHAR